MVKAHDIGSQWSGHPGESPIYPIGVKVRSCELPNLDEPRSWPWCAGLWLVDRQCGSTHQLQWGKPVVFRGSLDDSRELLAIHAGLGIWNEIWSWGSTVGIPDNYDRYDAP